MSSWRLNQRLLFASAIVVVLMAVAAAVVYTSYGRLVESQREVTRPMFQSVRAWTDLSSAVLDQETGVRGYALSDSVQSLRPYREGLATEEEARGRLEALLDDHYPELAAELDEVLADVEAWRARFAEPAIALVRDGGDLSAAQLRDGEALFDALRVSGARFESALLSERQRAVDDVEGARERMVAVFGIGLVLLLGALAVQIHLLRRWILRPLDDLGAESLTVASGQLDHEVVVDGPPEFVALASDVDMMRRRILGQLEEASAARESLEDQRRVLAAQAAELQRSNAELEQFAYVASHDLQEPLRKVASFTQMLQQRYEGQLDDRAQQYIGFAVDGAQRMQQLVNDLLVFSRVAREPRPSVDVALDDVLADALRALDAQVAETGAEITHDRLPVVTGERALLMQLFQNLVGNALKFARPGVPPRVHVGCRRLPAEWEVSVSDNGIGIDPQFAERVFVIFQRLNRREEYAGTGIGLALCRKIVEHHGGRIWLDVSGPPQESGRPDADGAAPGTTFRFTLPAADRS